MIYLSRFRFPTREAEDDFRFNLEETCFETLYPFFVLSRHGLEQVDFEPITIFYGGNGSGKTTALNVIAETLGLRREAVYNRSDFFESYTGMCSYKLSDKLTKNSCVITSDDVFEYMLSIRGINEGVDGQRAELSKEYLRLQKTPFRMRSLDDYEQLKNVCDARRKSKSDYVRDRLMPNMREQSNGESGYMYFTAKIRENGLFLLDEPENSLSPDRQLDLLKYLEESARFFNCQLIIATHSPFLLSMRGAKIYDFDAEVVDVKRWTELKNVRLYHDFFEAHKEEF